MLSVHTQVETRSPSKVPMVKEREERKTAAVKNGLAHLPGRPVFAPQQLAGFRISDDLLILYVPADLFSGTHRDQTKMTGNRRVMSDFNRSNGRLAGSYAVEKVLLVAGRGVELDLAQFSR